MKTMLLRYKKGSKSAKLIAKSLKIKMIKLEGSFWKHREGKVVINWGNSGSRLTAELEKATFINKPSAVKIAANKLDSFRLLEAAGVSVPSFTCSKELAKPWITKGRTVVARTTLTGNSGEGIVICDAVDALPDAPMYTMYIPKTEEYRVHVGSGEVMSVQRKARNKDVEDADVNWKVRNAANGFVFARNEGRIVPPQVLQEATAAVEALCLDFGAVDVVWNATKNKAFVLEVNTAPGVEGTTLEEYKEYFENVLINSELPLTNVVKDNPIRR